jgi:serine protease
MRTGAGRSLVLVAAVSIGSVLVVPSISGQGPNQRRNPGLDDAKGHQVAARQVLVKFRARPQPDELAREVDADRDEEVGGTGVRLLHSRSHDTATLIDKLSRRPDVEFVEPDYVVQAEQTAPADPFFGSLWGLANVGQMIQGSTGTYGADIGATRAWDISSGSRANVVAVIDTGIDYTHPDLAANLWTAPRSFTVKVGNIQVTCAAGTHGFNAITNTCDPRDDNGHGTHVSGTIGATGNNSVGVAGVNWVASIMAAKFLDAKGSGFTSDAINAIEFIIQAKSALSTAANVRVLSNSWGGGGFSQALLDEINRANGANMLFVAAAGNTGTNNDTSPFHPASYTASNVLSVAATDNNDHLASFSNYGMSTVHLGAPGVNVLSTWPGGGYGWLSGTSMAVPQVSGGAALALAACSFTTTAALKNALLAGVDTFLGGWTITGGRLNVGNVLQTCASSPAPDFSLSVAPSTQTIYQGAAATYAINVGALGGFTGTVTLSVAGLPTGATGTLTPASVNGSGSSALTIDTSSSTPAGTYPLTVKGVGGSITHTFTVTLIVTAQAQADFTISASPSSTSVKRGATASFTVKVIPIAGFAESVSFGVAGLPAGSSASFGPAGVPASGTSTLVVNTGPTRGTFTLTIAGLSATRQHSTSVTLRVK